MTSALRAIGAIALCFGGLFGTTAQATTYPVTFSNLTASATIAAPLVSNDAVFVNTLVTTEVGALTQTLTFTLASALDLVGNAGWIVTALPGPRLVGVNIDLFDFSNSLVLSDSFNSVTGGFAISTLAGSLAAGTYRLVATGTAVGDASLDISLRFVSAVPEPASLMLMLAGLGVLGFAVRRSSAV